MNGRSIFSIAIVVLMLTSGPLALPLSIYLLQSPSKQVNASPDKTILPKMGTTLIVKASASPTSGSSPLFVSLTANINTDNMTQFIQLYKWDFDGDGLDDYVSLDRAPTTHVYETSVSSVFNTTLTIVMKDGSTSKGSVLINVEPTDPTQWLEIKDMGPAKFGINTNGTIFIYDQTSWIPLTFAKNAEPLKGPTVAKPKEDKSRVTYRTGSTLLDVNIVFGAEGMATFNMTEYLPRGSNDLSQLGGLTLPTGVAKGGLVFSYLDSPPKIDKKQSVVNVLYFPKVQTGSGNVWGTGGAAYSPWRDQGVTPYGEYFKGLQEYVATETGYLTVTQTDLNIPGRGLDLVIKRVSAPPSTFDGWQPAFANDYTYQNNPWAPMGNGWSLSFPWIETFAGTPTYIHLGNGQRYKYNSSNGGTNVYHSGDHFKLYKYANSSYALYTADGVKYVFDSSCKPTKIIDVDGNQITLTYTSNKITSITDTIGRSVTVSYNTDGLVSSISTGGLSVSYTYVNGIVTGKRLATVTDPQGRVTKNRYLTDYLISQIEYPTGGYSTYNYGAYYSSGYSRYRVTSQTIHDASTSVSSCKTYTYTATYGSVTDVTISEYSSETLTKKTVLDYSQSNRVSKSIYDGESNRYCLTNEFIDSTHRRKTIDKYPGYLSTYNETISRYDSWGNVVYEKEYLGHERYYSYLNTDTSGKYVDSNGAQVGYFTDSFYGPTPNAEIHNLLAGEAEFQNGVGSLPIESYYKYDSRGHMTEVKQLKDGGWLVTSASYDSYGNPNKVTDPNGYLTYYIYNSTYSGAYLTSIKRRLVGSPSQNVTASYGYNSTTGLLIRGVDEKGNATAYRYDKVGRTTNVTYPRVNGVTAKRSAVYYDDAVYSSTYSPSTVVAATSSQYVSWTNRYIVKAAGLWWAFYYIGSSQYVYYKTSPDGSTWSSQTPIIYTPWTDNWGICYDGTYFQLTYSACGWMYRLYYIRGQPWSNGTIKWGAYQTVVQNDGNWYIDCKIVTDSYGYTWIAFKTQSTPFSYIDVYKNTKKDGTWSSDPAPSTYYSSTIDSSESHLKWASLTNGKLALLLSACEYLGSPDLTCVVWNGGSWGSKETIATWTSSVQPYDAVAVGDNVYAAFQTDSNGVQMRRRDYSSATWGTASNVVSNRPVQLTKTDWNDIYAIYVSGTNINYKVYDGSAWSTESTLVSGDSPMSVNTISSTYQAKDSRLGVVYQKSSSGYSVRFEILSLRETRNPKMTTFDENCNKVINYYDGVGRLVKTERYNGTTLFSTESHTFNYLGLTASKTTATGQVYRYDYSGMGDLVKTTNPDGSYSSTTINYSYNTWDARDEVGRRKILAYDCMGRLRIVKEYYDATNFYTTTYTYDEVGNLKKITDGSLHDTNYLYDQLDRLTKTTYTDSTYESRGYDKNGNLLWTRKPDGSNVTRSYDSLNRLTQTSYPDGSSSTLGYDKAGNEVHSVWNGTTVDRLYDARGRLTREVFTISGTLYTVKYGYDGVGNVVWMNYPGGENVSIAYDKLNRLRALGSYATITYTLDDKVNLISYGNGVYTGYSYDTRSRPRQIRVYKGSTTLLNCTYTYDNSGSITQIRNATATESYGYDQLDRLTSTSGPWGSITYTYDAVGNMLTKGSTSYTYNNMNRLTRVGTSDDYSYDSNGNLVSREAGADTWTYGYNGENQLVWVKKNGALQIRESYDADGRRVKSYGGASGNNRYVYSGLNVIYEVPDSGGSATLRLYASGLQVAEKTDSTVTYLHQDHLGSTRLKTDSSGNKVFRDNYQPFGVDSGISGSEEFRYTGKPTDSSTGLVYFGARYYDPSIGRFITEDAHPGGLSDPQSFNRYVYCRNNPHKYTDPDGKEPITFFALCIATMTVSGLWNAYSYWRNNPGDWGGTFNHFLIGFDTAGAALICTLGLPLVASAVGLEAASVVATPAATGVVKTAVKDYLDLDANTATLTDYALSIGESYASFSIKQYVAIPIASDFIQDDLTLQASTRFAITAWTTPIYPPIEQAFKECIGQWWLDIPLIPETTYPKDAD